MSVSGGIQREVIGNATLYLGDCRELIGDLWAGDPAVVVTDPPYGIGWKPRVNHQSQTWVDQMNFDIRDFIKGRFNLVWGAQYFADKLPFSQAWLTWVKRPLSCDFSRDSRSYATTELAWCDWGKARFISHVWDGGMRAGDPDNRTFCHPSQKPIEVMDWCVASLPIGIWRVIDPFMGSGTTGIAAVRKGHKFVGIEQEPEYFDIACRRLEAAQRQGSLFTEQAA